MDKRLQYNNRYWNVGFCMAVVATQGLAIFLGPITKCRNFYHKQAERRQEQRAMLKMEIELEELNQVRCIRHLLRASRSICWLGWLVGWLVGWLGLVG